MNIMHQVNNLSIGGVEVFVYRLCKFSNEPVAVYSHQDGIVGRWLEAINVPVFLSNDSNIFNLIEGMKIDVLVMHTGSYLPDYVPKLKKRFPELKLITVLHTVYHADEWVDKIICVSKAIKDVNNHEKSILIYPGIERRQKFVIGEITRLAPYKYLADLVFVAKEVVKENDNVLFKIIGEEAVDAKGYLDYLKTGIKNEGLENHFEFVGYVDKIDYSWFDAFIHLVGDEAYPVTILEALNHNLPTFTYLKRGTKEIEHPMLFHHDNPEILAKHLLRFMKLKPKHIKQVADEFSVVYKRI